MPDKEISAEGFLSYFLELRLLFPTYEQAYEELEAQPNTIPSAGFISAGSKKKNAHRSER